MPSLDKNGSQNHDSNLTVVQDSMLDGLGQLASYFGFSKVMGQLYGALMLSASPLSLDDLVELLDISKASVSMNLRTLEHLGMVRQVWVKGRGDRRKFYEAETDFWQIISNVLAGREMRDVDRALNVIGENAKRLAKSMDSMSEADKELAQLYIVRMEEMQSLFRFAQLLITSILGKAEEMDVSQVSRIDLE
ncbi:MAG: helix-turn-helix domain-containing protein [Chloroflexi bacterium]|nr:helix-turn-helix domain-containing protein [Chloroflexota bacterium]MCC6896370.1 helix-turn-helix domain-containing protein [Anaerolineae bacterium]